MPTSFESDINLYLPHDPEIEDPLLYSEFKKVYVALMNLQNAVGLLTGVDRIPGESPENTITSQNYNAFYAVAGENIDAGDVCYIYEDAGVLKTRKAVASAGSIQQANCLCNQAGGVLVGEVGLFIAYQGYSTLLSGLTTGTVYYVDAANAGKLTATKPALPNMIQEVGVAFSATHFMFNAQAPVDQTPRTFAQL